MSWTAEKHATIQAKWEHNSSPMANDMLAILAEIARLQANLRLTEAALDDALTRIRELESK